MGAGKIKPAVIDAGPLIHLSEISQLRLLNVFSAIDIPDAVWGETVSKGRIDAKALNAMANIHRHSLSDDKIQDFVKRYGIESLDAGESACLALCKHLKSTLLLTDDLAARKHAKRLNIVPVGSLGIIVKAYVQGLIGIEETESYLWALFDKTSLYVTEAIVELAIDQVRQHSRQ